MTRRGESETERSNKRRGIGQKLENRKEIANKNLAKTIKTEGTEERKRAKRKTDRRKRKQGKEMEKRQ